MAIFFSAGVTFSKPSFWVAMLVFGGGGVATRVMLHHLEMKDLQARLQICPLYIFGNKAADGTYRSKYWFQGFGFHSGPNRQPCQASNPCFLSGGFGYGVPATP